MGRLDEHAKKRIVELRKAGLSFRKIKKVLELDNIRVTPQAVYLFLKRKNVEPEQPGGITGSQQVRGSRNPWEDEQLWNLLNENGSDQSKRKDPAATAATGPGGQPGLLRQQCPEGQPGLLRQQCPEGQPGLLRQQCPEGQPGLLRQQCPEGQPGLLRQQCPEGQPGPGRQQCPEGQPGPGRQQCPDGQPGPGRQQCPDGQPGPGRQQCPEGQQCLGRQQGPEGQQGFGRKQSPDGQQVHGHRQQALPSGGAVNQEISDHKDGIKIVSVTSLCEDGRQFGKASAPVGPCPGIQLQPQPKKSDCSVSSASQPPISVSRPPAVGPVNPQQQLNGRGRMPFALPRNPALIVRKKIVDRAIHLQKRAFESQSAMGEDRMVGSGGPFRKVAQPGPGVTRSDKEAPEEKRAGPPERRPTTELDLERMRLEVEMRKLEMEQRRREMEFELEKMRLMQQGPGKVNIQNGQAVSGSSQMLPFLVGVPPSVQSPRMNHSVLPNSRSMGTQVMDACTQTIPAGTACTLANQNSPWSGQAFAQVPGGSPKSMVEKLEAVHGEVQKLTQALHAMAERQNRMERQQEQQQQRFQQEVLGTLQQISSSLNQQQQQQLCHAQSPLNQACLPYGNMAEAAPALPSFGQFKMELL